MCKKKYFFILFAGLLLASTADAPQAEQQGWYLISEPELRSIEQYRERSEAEKQSWLSQANGLKAQAERLNARAANSLAELEALNQQLSEVREAQRKSEWLYEQSETEKLTLLSLKNGEIAGLKQTAAEKALEAEKSKGTAFKRLIAIIALAGAILAYTAYRIYTFFRPI
jgi:hypothetical protein